MLIPIFVLALVLGPWVFYSGKSSGSGNKKTVGLALWVLGWGYLAYVVFSLMQVAG